MMHSYGGLTYIPLSNDSVLILVLMDDALVLRRINEATSSKMLS